MKEYNKNTKDEGIKPRKIHPQNIVKRLINREIFGDRKPGTQIHITRKFYQNVFPNLTIVNVEKPPCFLRKFSPDGKHFIAFSADQASVEIYQYQGAGAAADLIKDCTGDYVPNKSEGTPFEIRSKVFDRFFKIKHIVNVCQSNKQLNRECSLFTDDGKYVIVGSACFIPDDLRPAFYDIYTSNEAVTPTLRSPLEDYSLHIIDLSEGRLCDSRHFKVDKIMLSHNQGLYLYNDKLAILSIQHQLIHIFQVVNGMFIEVRTIGRFCYEDDNFQLITVYGTHSLQKAFKENIICSLKHRLLVYLYKQAMNLSIEMKNYYALRKFYQNFEQFKSLRMWKMQLLNEDHLLIKYTSEEVVTQKSIEPNNQISFFVVYNIAESLVIAVYENTSQQLLELFENFCDLFRNVKVHCDAQFTCSPSNNIHAKVIQQRFKHTIISARYGGEREATKRLLAQLPISAQSYSSSPYLDLSLFSYDDKWVSVMERPKACGEYPIRFYARDSGLLKFRIYAGAVAKTPPAATRRLVAFTFHPIEPFAISVQRTNSEYIVNFHVRHVN